MFAFACAICTFTFAFISLMFRSSAIETKFFVTQKFLPFIDTGYRIAICSIISFCSIIYFLIYCPIVLFGRLFHVFDVLEVPFSPLSQLFYKLPKVPIVPVAIYSYQIGSDSWKFIYSTSNIPIYLLQFSHCIK